MTTTIHSISINQNSKIQAGRNVRATRTSKSRQYAACIVATTTQAAVDLVASEKAASEAIVAELTPVVAAILEGQGKTHDEVRAQHDAATKAWYDALFPEERRLHEAEKARLGGRYAPMSDKTREQAKANLVASGLVDPYKAPASIYLDLARKLECAVRHVANVNERSLAVGDQFVISWHKDRSNALKASGARDAGSTRARGFSLEIRTDIEVTTKGQKA